MTQAATFAETFKRDWLSNIRADILAGIVVALALIPEAIGFALIAGASVVSTSIGGLFAGGAAGLLG